MEQKVKLNIQGEQYTILTDEDVKYVKQLGSDIDSKISEIQKASPRLSITQASILLNLNLSDDLSKSSESADHLRQQIKDYLEDAANAKKKAETLKSENEKLQRKLDDKEIELEKLGARLNDVLDKLGKK